MCEVYVVYELGFKLCVRSAAASGGDGRGLCGQTPGRRGVYSRLILLNPKPHCVLTLFINYTSSIWDMYSTGECNFLFLRHWLPSPRGHTARCPLGASRGADPTERGSHPLYFFVSVWKWAYQFCFLGVGTNGWS